MCGKFITKDKNKTPSKKVNNKIIAFVNSCAPEKESVSYHVAYVQR